MCSDKVEREMEFSVSRSAKGLVAPSGPTPSGILELSVVDRVGVLRCNARTLHVFRPGVGAVEVIREALGKALIPYYPLAGRLHVSDAGELQIACTGDGAWVVEASADCTLAALNYLDDAMSVPYEKLLPPPPPPQTDPLVQMQVTQFGCGGLVIGLIFCHSICDGLGAAQFLKAVGEMARGAHTPSAAPEWCRDFLPPSPSPSPSPPPGLPIPIPDYQLEAATIDVPSDEIKKLKEEYEQGSGGQRCSTFEMAAAMLWRRRTEAMGLGGEAQVRVVFFANCRHLVEPPLPEGFYGNCFFPVSVSARSGEVLAKGVFQLVDLIKEGKARLPEDFSKWAREGEREVDPFAPPLDYATLFISEWGRLGFMEVDYGWGQPLHVVPVQGSSIIPVGIVCSQPRPRTGVRLITWCLNKTHLPTLLQHFTS